MAIVRFANTRQGRNAMKLLLRRNQKSGMLTGKVTFTLDARLETTSEEASLVKKYGLGKLTIYSSETAQKHLGSAATSLATGNVLGLAKGAIRVGLAALSLRCTIDSLTSGQHIECKDMEELLAGEAAIVEACNNAKVFLEVSKTFDGREQVIEIGEATAAA